jgi:hypothetical protein
MACGDGRSFADEGVGDGAALDQAVELGLLADALDSARRSVGGEKHAVGV